LSLDRIVHEWTLWKELLDSNTFAGYLSEPDNGIRNDCYNQSWIPFTYNGAGDNYCLDLAPSFDQCLESYRQALHDGSYVYSDDEYYAIVPIDDIA
jgi:cell wall assembly regulator SMI1